MSASGAHDNEPAILVHRPSQLPKIQEKPLKLPHFRRQNDVKGGIGLKENSFSYINRLCIVSQDLMRILMYLSNSYALDFKTM